MIPGNEDGKIGFLIALMALITLMGSFGAMALMGSSDLLLSVTVGSIFFVGVGHFVLRGGEYRTQMMEEKRKKREE
ncbi:MAG: hypothetical protein ACNA8W_20695 [Bradymonadaceae bacterium]